MRFKHNYEILASDRMLANFLLDDEYFSCPYRDDNTNVGTLVSSDIVNTII